MLKLSQIYDVLYNTSRLSFEILPDFRFFEATAAPHFLLLPQKYAHSHALHEQRVSRFTRATRSSSPESSSATSSSPSGTAKRASHRSTSATQRSSQRHRTQPRQHRGHSRSARICASASTRSRAHFARTSRFRKTEVRAEPDRA